MIARACGRSTVACRLSVPWVTHVPLGGVLERGHLPDATPRPSPSVDGELVARAARGDERAIGELYDRYGAVLYAVAYRIVGQHADAEEVVLEAFTQAWRDAARYDPARGSVFAWLVTICRTRAPQAILAR